jgi:hypothetical protein
MDFHLTPQQVAAAPRAVAMQTAMKSSRKLPGPLGEFASTAKKARAFTSPRGDSDQGRGEDSVDDGDEEPDNDGEVVENEFQRGPWLAMLDQTNTNLLLATSSSSSSSSSASASASVVPFPDCIKSILKDGFTAPVPRIAVLVKTVATADWGDAYCVVRDPTGEMSGTIHRTRLCPGCHHFLTHRLGGDCSTNTLFEIRFVSIQTCILLWLMQQARYLKSTRDHYASAPFSC